MEYDVFISHASEDRAPVARPLANRLRELGVKVWLDELELKLGDNLRRSIDRGLSQSKFGVVILSHTFFRKEWPQRELDGLVSREVNNKKVILPIWHNISKKEISQFSPILADRLAVSTKHGIDYVAQQILDVVKDTSAQDQEAEGRTAAISTVLIGSKNIIGIVGVLVLLVLLAGAIAFFSKELAIESPPEAVLKGCDYDAICHRFSCSVYNGFADKKISRIEVELNVPTPNGPSVVRSSLQLTEGTGKSFTTSKYGVLVEYEGEISLYSHKLNVVLERNDQPSK